MISGRHFAASGWDGIGLVAFDMDGTLYSQNRLRVRMLRDLLLHAVSARSLDAVMVIGAYRRIRERLAERQVPRFEDVLVAETAAATGRSPDQVRSIVDEWIERRPLPYLAACRYPGLAELFAGLRRNRKTIGILSDYPARAKLAALGLDADRIVCAGDQGIGLLKPNPRGFQAMIEAAAVKPEQAVLIGDRADRDGVVARQIGAWPLIRSAKPIEGWQTFARFDDALFQAVLPA
jgi:FMN phosphatase YigB (HAD superfamily)